MIDKLFSPSGDKEDEYRKLRMMKDDIPELMRVSRRNAVALSDSFFSVKAF